MNKYLRYLFFIVLIALVGVGIWAFMIYCEGEEPEILLNRDIKMIGQETTFDVVCIDRKRGLRTVSVDISQDGKKYTLSSLNLPQGGVHKETLAIDVFPEDLKLHDGTAMIDITVTDHSLRKNTKAVTFEVIIDTIPPQISPVSFSHYINPGGACVVVYNLSENVPHSGVQVDNDFFPSYPATTSDTTHRISYFAIPIMNAAENNLKITILAQDDAGNRSLYSVPFHIRKKNFRSDTMNISQRFLETKMPEFQHRYKDLKGTTLLEAFSRTNSEMRANNQETIQKICKDTRPEQLWEGTFLRMKNAAPMAGFGEERSYVFEGMTVSRSTHLGVDLASTERASIESANHGSVVFAGPLGIYGNAVIVDHGLGLCSLYAHLSEISVKAGQAVTRGETLGASGSTGLASGDHLHFSILVGGEFVNPTEWWDAHWIRDNVTGKLSESASQSAAPAANAQPAKAKTKPKKKKARG